MKKKIVKSSPKKYKMQDIASCYENYQIKIGRKWIFVTPDKLKKMLKNTPVEGTIVKKRTRTWLE